MKNEKCSTQEIFDQLRMSEIERKFIPCNNEDFAPFRQHESLVAIEQLYLSAPHEPYSLRLRSTASELGVQYEATLKNRGEMQADGIHRLEVTAPISAQLYHCYASDFPPLLRKLRAEPVPDVTVDFYEDGTVQIESENQERWQEFEQKYGIATREITGLPEGDNERRAYQDIQYQTVGDITADRIATEVLTVWAETNRPTTIHIGGRSGSGKSTIVHQVRQELLTHGVTSVVMSTDDYHRGEAWLTKYNNNQPWQQWDEPIVYDTEAMACDLRQLAVGESIQRRTVDWQTAEPRLKGVIDPADVIIIEGIYALSPHITAPDNLVYELTTPLATCVGRRLLRDIEERPQFADPVRSLSYMLSDVEPAYRNQRASRTIQ